MSDAVEDFLSLYDSKEKLATYGYTKSVLLRGALPGALAGAGTGAMVATPEDRLKSTLTGAGVGAALGAAGGAAADYAAFTQRKGIIDALRRAKTPDARTKFKKMLEGETFKDFLTPGEMGELDPEGHLVRYGERKLLGMRAPELAATVGGTGASLATLPFLREKIRSKKEEKMDKESMEKEAVFGAIKKVLGGDEAAKMFKRTFRHQVASTGGKGVAAIGTLGLTYGATKAIQEASDAIGRSRGYKKMMEVNPDLAEGEYDDEQMKGMYNLLHKAAPTFAKNPYVAGSFIRRTESAAKFVDPQMIKNLADAESSMHRASPVTGAMQMATGFMPGTSLSHSYKDLDFGEQ